MKKIIRILVSIVLPVVLLSSCASYKDIRIVSAGLSRISPLSSPIEATISYEVDNPAGKLELTGINGTINYDGAPLMTFTASDVILPRHSVSSGEIAIQALPAEGVGIFQLLRVIKAQDLNKITIDAGTDVKTGIGIKKRREIKGLCPATLTGK